MLPAHQDDDQALRLDPKDAIVFKLRGDSYLVKDDADHAMADFSESIRLDPKRANVFNIRGIAFALKRDLDSAITDFNEGSG